MLIDNSEGVLIVEAELRKGEKEVALNPTSLVDDGDMEMDRFTLYPTHNHFIFLLLDQHDGRIWRLDASGKSKGLTAIASE